MLFGTARGGEVSLKPITLLNIFSADAVAIATHLATVAPNSTLLRTHHHSYSLYTTKHVSHRIHWTRNYGRRDGSSLAQ